MMKEVFLGLVVCAILAGCHTVATTNNESPAVRRIVKHEEPASTLRYAMAPTTHINTKDEFEHDGKDVKVLQVSERIERNGVDIYFMICTHKDFDSKFMTIAVFSTYPYVTNEMLQGGEYIYIGPYTYEAKRGNQNTVRTFFEKPTDEILKKIGNVDEFTMAAP